MKYTLTFFLSIIFSLGIAQDERWDPQFLPANAPADSVFVMVASGSDIYIGGSFTSVAGVSANYIAKWNGLNWESLGAGTSGPVYSLAFQNSDLYVGGNFISAGGIFCNNIAKWDGTTWSGIGSGANGKVRTIASKGSDVFIGGDFTNINGTAANRIAHWDGITWSALGSGFNGSVFSIYIIGPAILTGGTFTTAGGSPASHIAKWDGSSWIEYAGGLNDTVFSVHADLTYVYAGGAFTNAGGTAGLNYFGIWNGSNWTSAQTGVNKPVHSIIGNIPDLFVGGRFTVANGNPVNHIARWDNISWSALGSGTNGNVYSIVSSGYDLYTGGSFTQAGNKPASRFCRWGTPPQFTTVPTSSTVCAGDNVTLPASVSGSGIFYFQWKKNGTDIPGANFPALDFNPVAVSDAGNYQCVVRTYIDTIYSPIITLTVNALPIVNFIGLVAEYCQNSPGDTLKGSPGGGTFTGAGMAGTHFNPALCTPGTIPVTYSYTDLNSCTASITQSTLIHPIPLSTISGLENNYCSNSSPEALSLSPSGGTLTGLGLTGNTFYPATLAAGNYTITYICITPFGCTDTASEQTTVHNLPSVSYTGLDADYCVNVLYAPLHPTPSGGFFSGTGMTDSIFHPSIAGPGSYIISYSFTDAFGCSNIYSENTDVHALPVVSISGLNSSYCSDHAPVVLTGTPAGGTFNGTGMISNTFYPGLCSAGTHAITYSYTDSYNCISSDTIMVNIGVAATTILSGLSSQYCADDPVVNLTGTPAGGTFSGPGIFGSQFSPTLAGGGIHHIIYSYDNLNGCISYDTVEVTVNFPPALWIDGDTSICAGEQISLTANGTPGIYDWSTGDHVQTIIKYPTSNTIYTVTVTVGVCTATEDVNVSVHQLPIIDLGPGDTLCMYGTLTAAGGFASYLWSNSGDTDSITTVTYSGYYNVTVTDVFGCTGSDGVLINMLPTPAVNLGSDLAISYYQVVTLGVSSGTADHYLWITDTIIGGFPTNDTILMSDTILTIDVTGTVYGAGNHTIWVVAYNDNGCSSSDTIIVNINFPVGINEDENTAYISVFPIPVQTGDVLNIDYSLPSETGTLELSVIDISGKIVHQALLSERKQQIELRDLFLQKGVYFIRIKGEQFYPAIKIVVQ